MNGPQRILQKKYWQMLTIDGKVQVKPEKVKNDPEVNDRLRCEEIKKKKKNSFHQGKGMEKAGIYQVLAISQC